MTTLEKSINLTTMALNQYFRNRTGTLDAAETIKLLRKNKYPLLSLDMDSLPEELRNAPEFQQALADDRESWESQRAYYLEVQAEWNRRGIYGVFIKTACIAPTFPYTSDNLDVLVPWERAAEAAQVVRDMGFVELRNIEEQNKFLFRKFRNGESVCAIHIHRWVGWNINFFEEDVIRSRSRPTEDDPEILAPSTEDALLINLSHAYYENKRFSLYDLEKMHSSWRQHDLDWDYMHETARRSGWHDGFLMGILLAAHIEEQLTGSVTIPAIELERCKSQLQKFPRVYRYCMKQLERTVEMPFKVSFLFSKWIYYQKIWRDTHDSARQKAYNTFRTLVWGFRLKTGIRPNRGLVVAISGMDGSGKTSQAELLCRVLEISEIPHTHYWNRISCSPFANLVGRFASRPDESLDSGTTSFSSGQSDMSHRSGVVQATWAWLMALDLAIRYTWRVRVPVLRGYLGLGKVVVCDRYALDACAEIQTRVPNAGWGVRSAMAFLRAVAPRPHQSYLFDVPEDVALERHPFSIPREALKQNRKQYLDLAELFNTDVRSGMASAAELSDRLVTEVVDEYEARYPNWLNALLLWNPSQLNPGMSPKGK